MVKFLRKDWKKYSKLGKKRKKKLVWKRPSGRDNKMREKRKGYPAVVSVGYKKNKNLINKIEGKKPVIVKNIKDLEKIKDDEIIILGKIGEKKKIEIMKKVKEMKVKIYKKNVEKFLKKLKNLKTI